MIHPPIYRISSVDMNGYCGRDHHPQPSDIGLIVVPVRMDVVHNDEEGDETSFENLDGVTQDDAFLLHEDHDNLSTVWTCVTRDGRILQLMGHELSEVK